MCSLLRAVLVATDPCTHCATASSLPASRAHVPRGTITFKNNFRKELLADAELAEHAVQHFLCDIIPTDLPQRCYRRSQVNSPEVNRKTFADAVCDC